MALQLILGNSGSGKTALIHRNMIKEAIAKPDQKIFFVVPEQFTMQTQRKLVEAHPGRSILNIDVLSFGRLSHRVFDELGCLHCPVLEETGKNLILRRVAQEKTDALTILKGNMTKMGYIGEVKSLLSELAQYNVTPSQLSEAIEKLPQGSFSYKLKDVLTMYQGFLDFTKGRFVTAEGMLELFVESAGQSQMLKDSVLIFDGFTGFTPIQKLAVAELLKIAKEVYVTVTIDIREDPYHCAGSHELFAMSKKMIRSLMETAQRLHIPVKEPILCKNTKKNRFQNAPSLHFLEQNLFRGARQKQRLEKERSIRMYSLKNPREELGFIAREIERLVRREGYRYREIAIVCGDLPLYADYAQEVFSEYRIPLFLDQKTSIVYHPFIEFLRAALEAVICDFSLDGVFRYLRSRFSGFSRAEVDRLENYCLEAGVSGYRKWNGLFCYLPSGYTEESLLALNEIRSRVMAQFQDLRHALKRKACTAGEITRALYQFICEREAQRQLKQSERAYEAAGDLKNAREYAQIYKIVIDLLDKVMDLLGDEAMPPKEYAKILDAGFEAAKVGIIPPGYDRIVFGDIERTRLDDVKALFFAGVYDGVIPGTGGSDGILTQSERERLEEMQLELAPTEREKTFIQRFYLYLNLTKPAERLYLTYARVNGEGKAQRGSYLISAISKLYENLTLQEIDAEPFSERIVTEESARTLLLEGISSAEEWVRQGKEEEIRYWAALCRWYEKSDAWRQEAADYLEAAKQTYVHTPISASVTKALYGTVLENSVTRLEAFAACAFSHFLSYGLQLRERLESGFYAVDYGMVFHEVLERFSEGIRSGHYSWFTITEDESEALLQEAMTQTLAASHNLALFENARSSYAGERMYRILRRTVNALLYQVRKGAFTPDGFEVAFSCAQNLESVRFALSEEEQMHLRGRIDRIDTLRKGDKLYVKVIDYKSADTSLQLVQIYHGLSLQLVVYMNAALELMEQKYPGCAALPAGIFYYHVNDPMIEADAGVSEEALQKKILETLKLRGLVSGDREILSDLDHSLREANGVSSDVIPVGFNKDGSLKKASKTLTDGEFKELSSYVDETILHLGQRMLKGEISVSPYALAGRTGCDYCAYRSVCRFDPKAPGYAYRRLKELSEESALDGMKGAGE